MDYSLSNLPNSGSMPVVYMDIMLGGDFFGRIYIRLVREAFPAGVENFVRIADGQTTRIIRKGTGKFRFRKEIKRTYEDARIFNFLFNNYIVSGDIYNNNGSNAGTIFGDQPIPADVGDFFFPHEAKGLVSLVPFRDEATGKLMYDSTFMITLADAGPNNLLRELDEDQIVIGQVYDGLAVLDKINELIKPYARRRYPEFTIGRTGVYRVNGPGRNLRPVMRNSKQPRNIPNGSQNMNDRSLQGLHEEIPIYAGNEPESIC